MNESNSWIPNIQELEKMNLSKVKIMWINYPNMPTGSNCSLSFLDDLISFCEKKNILLINDNPYSFILNDNPISLLMAKKSKNCLELNSLSKSHNMAGWRLGMVVGSKENIDSILKIKSNMDSGMFLPIQIGAIDALNQGNDWYSDLNEIYLKRKKIVFKICEKLNL